ncbi:MAG: ferredoxin reductase [Nocardioides sp.]
MSPPALKSTLASGSRSARLARLAEAATTPLLPADYLDLFAPLRSGAPLRGRVESIVAETEQAATLVIKPGADWAGHLPGQYLRLGVDIDGVRQWRAYSLTHGPRADGRISITVKAVPDGLVSTYLVHRARPGTLVHLEQAAGEFVLPTDRAGSRLLFVTAGSGITPVIGMLRNLFPGNLFPGNLFPGNRAPGRPAYDPGYDIVVVHVAPTEPDSIFRRDLRALDAAGAIRLIARYDDTHGVLDIADLATLVPDLADRITFACGPAGLLADLTDHHGRRGLPLFIERFRSTRLVAGQGGTVEFDDGTVVTADGATPILDAAEAAGVLMPSGCRMGICFGCVLPLREGVVRDLRDGTVTIAPESTATADVVHIQTCISAAAGACRLEH